MSTPFFCRIRMRPSDAALLCREETRWRFLSDMGSSSQKRTMRRHRGRSGTYIDHARMEGSATDTRCSRAPRAMAAPWAGTGGGAMHMLRSINRRLAAALVLLAFLGTSPLHASDWTSNDRSPGFWVQIVEWLEAVWNESISAQAEDSETETPPQDIFCYGDCDRGHGIDPNG